METDATVQFQPICPQCGRPCRSTVCEDCGITWTVTVKRVPEEPGKECPQCKALAAEWTGDFLDCKGMYCNECGFRWTERVPETHNETGE